MNNSNKLLLVIHVCSVHYLIFIALTDGTVLGVVLDAASEEELTQFDSLLTELASLKVKEEAAVAEGTGEQKVGVAKGEETQWGSTVSEVSCIVYQEYMLA